MKLLQLPKSLLGSVLRGPRQAAPAPSEPDVPLPFDEAAFRRREVFRPNYATVCGALTNLIPFDTVLDLGCGNGFLLDAMLALGKDARGVELSPEVVPLLPAHLRDRVQIADAVRLGRVGRFDLVACVEVAEHIPADASTTLVDTIAANAGRWVYFTAASPHQPGHGHINCRPQFFWMNEFRKRGFEVDWGRTERLVEAIRNLSHAVWLPLNSLIFVRQ